MVRITQSVLRTRRVASLIPFFFFNDTATTEIYTLSLHDALPISVLSHDLRTPLQSIKAAATVLTRQPDPDRKSTRLNSSHLVISYAVFCLKKKKSRRSSRSRSPHREIR